MNQEFTTTTGLNRFFAKVYGIFGVGLAISALAAYLCSTVFVNQFLATVNQMTFILFWVFEIVLVLVIGRQAFKNPALTLAGFIVYSLLNGVTLSVTLLVYDFGTVTSAFAASSLTFIAMAVFGIFTKKDLSGIARALYSFLIGALVVILVNIFMQSSAVDYFISFVLVIIFSGLTAYDNQRIREAYFSYQMENDFGIATFMALQLYLDFINLFLAFVRIFGRDQ